MGIAGIKVDFFSGDSVSTMNYYIDLLEDAIKYKLMLNFHGATIPRGWQRTYPHMMSVEGVYGAEWYNNAPILTNRAAEHNATLPFTRNVVGPMDYTPGTFPILNILILLHMPMNWHCRSFLNQRCSICRTDPLFIMAYRNR